jgi:glycosyltransferase involved in cell wall biosynthesis
MKVFITYEYFLPAYKAGGPIQSLNNMVQCFAGQPGYEFYIYCSDKDLDGSILNVKRDEWVSFLPNTKVYYRSEANKEKFRDILNTVKPDVLFVNGLFSKQYSIIPLQTKTKAQKILSVRGMLHPGALSQKSFKKKLFLAGLKFTGVHKRIIFHATADGEAAFIKKTFGNRVKTLVVANLPKAITAPKPLAKQPGMLQLVSVALISPMKNILLVLNALKQCRNHITYDIYGPVKDEAYWEECQVTIGSLPSNVKVHYKGPVPPEQVTAALNNYHAFILPSKSENFGHAIYEALASGKPVITSHYTPWNGLATSNAGYNVSVEDVNEMSIAIDALASVNNDTYTAISNAAAAYAGSRINTPAIMAGYKTMFTH